MMNCLTLEFKNNLLGNISKHLYGTYDGRRIYKGSLSDIYLRQISYFSENLTFDTFGHMEP